MGYFAIDTSPELKHYGVLGMKWGIRKEKQQVSNRTRKNKLKKIRRTILPSMSKPSREKFSYGYYLTDSDKVMNDINNFENSETGKKVKKYGYRAIRLIARRYGG